VLVKIYIVSNITDILAIAQKSRDRMVMAGDKEWTVN